MQTSKQLLIFALGDELFGADILRVKEIRAIGKIRAIPDSPKHVLGVLDYRDVIVPVVDLRVQFGFANDSLSPQTVMIIVNLMLNQKAIPVGIVVDRVSDVVDFEQQVLQPMPPMSGNSSSNLLLGMFKHESDLLVMLDLDLLLDHQDLSHISNYMQAGVA